MAEITYGQAIRDALAEEMRIDDRVFVMGEDVGCYGGSFKVTKGLWEEFGEERVRDTPITEAGFVGTGVGAALTGMRPVVEVMFCDFTTIAMDQLVNQAAKLRYMTAGQVEVPLVIRSTMGGGKSGAAQHSQSLHAWFAHVPGLKVVAPATPHDVKGMLKAAIRDPNPVIFFEHKLLYNLKGSVPEQDYTVPLGKADIKRSGEDVTVVANSLMVHEALRAAEALESDGISVEVIDLRSFYPIDLDTLTESVCRTNRAVVVDEGVKRYGVSAEITTLIYEHAFDYLDAPVTRVAGRETPMPFSPPLESAVIPGEEDIVVAIRRVLAS